MYIWENTLDKKYHVFVERKSESIGTLVIEDSGTRIFEKEVSLAYRAIFGPDIDDVQNWERLCIEYVDSLNK